MARGDYIKDLEYWDGRVREKAAAFGLSTFAQEFELCDHEQMLSYMAYHGMPSHYPHWSYGKAYERQKTLYEYGVSGLPYEMVINADPCLAHLMRKNSLALQVLTIAHVYGHNDFFKNNFTFRATRPERLVSSVKARADRIRHYIEDPSIGLARVEALLDASHALALQCGRNVAVRKLSRKEQRERARVAAERPPDPYRRIHKAPKVSEPDLDRLPLEPDDDLLIFIRDHNPRLADWEKDLLTIVHEEALYFIPQIQTKIMNEGWATYWHWQIMDSLDLPQDLHLEFLVRHNQVVRPTPGDINPYHLGFKLWQDIRRRCDEPRPDELEESGAPEKDGLATMFQVREVDRDVSFLRRFLTKDLIRELGLFQVEQKGETLVATKVADDESWREIKETLLRNVGMGGIPVIRVIDADHGRRGELLLRHEHDGRDLHLEYAERTLAYLRQLWGRGVALETRLEDEPRQLQYDDEGFTIEQAEV
jgi:stage V sporulation protein R